MIVQGSSDVNYPKDLFCPKLSSNHDSTHTGKSNVLSAISNQSRWSSSDLAIPPILEALKLKLGLTTRGPVTVGWAI